MATVGERIIEALGGVTAQRMTEAVQRASEASYAAGYNDGNDEPVSGTLASFGYRSTAKALRDFSKATPSQLMDTAWALWQSSPIAKRVLQIKRDHIAGRSVMAVIKKDDATGEIVDAFWQRNQMAKRVSEFALQLFLLGEQCFPAYVRESDGRVTLGYLDPAHITEVIANPYNAMQMCAVAVGDVRGKASGSRLYRIIREDEETVSMIDGRQIVKPSRYPGMLTTAEQATLEDWEYQLLADTGRHMYDGSVFWTGVNRLSNQNRGVSDLIQVADWVDIAEETLFALGEREQYADYFSWDITLLNASATHVANRQKAIMANPPKKGSFNVHNDAEVWQLMYPELRQEGSINTYRAILGKVLGGVGIPVHWFGYGDDANRATALAQGDPTFKSLEHDQSVVREMLAQIVQFAIDQATIARTIRPADDMEMVVVMPELSSRDTALLVPLFGPYAVGLMTAIDAGWMTQETAAGAWAKLMGEFGIEIDAATELAAVADEAMQRERGTNNALSAVAAFEPPAGKDAPVNVEAGGLNGAQIAAVLEVLNRLSQRAISRDIARELLIAVGIDPAKAGRIVAGDIRPVNVNGAAT